MTVDITARLAEVMPGIRRDLEDLVRIQSVSADPERLGEVERSAEATVALFRAEGVDARIVRAYDGAPPAVIGEKRGPGGCADVYSSTRTTTSSPRTTPPTGTARRGSRPSATAGSTAAAPPTTRPGSWPTSRALRVLGDDLPVTVRLFIEGEEEVASATLSQLLEQLPRRARAPTSSSSPTPATGTSASRP